MAPFLDPTRKDLDFLFSVQHERVVSRDSKVVLGGKILQIEPTRTTTTRSNTLWVGTMAPCARKSGVSSGVSSIDETRHGQTHADISQSQHVIEMTSLDVSWHAEAVRDTDRKMA